MFALYIFGSPLRDAEWGERGEGHGIHCSGWVGHLWREGMSLSRTKPCFCRSRATAVKANEGRGGGGGSSTQGGGEKYGESSK